jgi:hypothetical protein
MDRYILNRTNTMNTISRVTRKETVVVGVAILGVSMHLHAQARLWRWAPSGLGATPQGF